MTTQVLRGRIEPLGLVDVLAYLGRTTASGALNVEQGDVKKSIFISDGTIVFARSNQVQDRLGDILLAQGLINQEQYDRGTELIYEKGFRHGRALVEIGAISPKMLWQTIQDQVKTIASSVIPWEMGQFEFIKKEIKRKEAITLKWPILNLVQDIIRNLNNPGLFKTRFHNLNAVLTLAKGVREEDIQLEPHEKYILDFIDGQTTVDHICSQSDYGEAESLRVIYLLKCLGWVEQMDEFPETDSETLQSFHPLIGNFNKIFSFLHVYLSDRVGKVGTNLLKKYFEDTRKTHLSIFKGVQIGEDGALNPAKVQENLDALGLDESSAEMVLDEAMNEYLNVGILAVKKVLGTEHESIVIQSMGELS